VLTTSTINRVPSIEIQHNVGSQKKGGFTRYDIDQRAHSILESELMIGFVQVKWESDTVLIYIS
jgi:hypothetical protein